MNDDAEPKPKPKRVPSLRRNASNAAPSAEDATLIEELLTVGVSLARVSELFRGRVGERELNAVARRVVVASAAAREDDDPAPAADGSAASASRLLPERLGMSVLERSKSAARDVSFVRGHAANLAADAPEELLDPLFFTVMRDPVVLSSGYVVDRSTALDGEGGLKFHACPFTRAPLSAEVYPLVCRRRQLQEYKERKVRNMAVTARALLDERNLEQFREVMEAAERFLDDLGDGTYVHLALRLAELALEAHDLGGPEVARPAELARIYVRMYRASPQFQDRSEEEEEKEEAEGEDGRSATEMAEDTKVPALQARVKDLSARAAGSIKDGRLDEALEWIEACDAVRESCPGMDVPPTATHRLALAKARGDEDLSGPRRLVYEEIRSDPDAVARLCEEEGIHPDNLRDTRPILLARASVNDYSEDDEWHCAVRSNPLEYEVSTVTVKAGHFTDQDWGYAKGNLGLALYDAGGTLVARCNLFGTYRSPDYTYGDHPSRVLGRDEEVVAMARPGFTYALEYTVGGGGGHSVHVECWFCKIFPMGADAATETVCPHSCRIEDPEGKGGLFIGPVDTDGKAHGRGEFLYDDACYIFIGNFSHGSMDKGVLYFGTEAKRTMEQGRWDESINSSIVEEFPHEIAICGNLNSSDEGNESDESDMIDGDSSENVVDLNIRNTTSFAVNLFWIDDMTGEEDCLDFDNPLPAGGWVNIDSHPDHRFVAYNEDRTFQRDFVVSVDYGEEEEFVVEE